MPIVTLQGLRGGTGTTSITAALGWALFQLGESVLVIDASPDNLLRLHFNVSYHDNRGWARALSDGKPWSEAAFRYENRLEFLPFGQLTEQELAALNHRFQQQPLWWQQQIVSLSSEHYRWVLFDLPAGGSAVQQAIHSVPAINICTVTADAASHVLLHQKTLPKNSHILLNRFMANSVIQQDLHQLWLNSLPGLLPLMMHHDEAVAESMAAKQPLGEYQADSLAAQEVMTLAGWCLIHSMESA